MESSYRVRLARPEDCTAIANVHVESWRQTYRGMMAHDVLDDTEFPRRREQMWNAVLTDPQYADRTTAVAEHDGHIVGIAMSGPSSDDDAKWIRQLNVLYLLNEHQGTSVAARLLAAVLDDASPVALWVADPNPRAQAFYRKVGFRPDGTAKVEDGVREMRMTRGVA